MKFKIDTKEKILILQPQISHLDANLSAGFVEQIAGMDELRDRNLILDMGLVETADHAGIQAILTVYHQQYDRSLSCAITCINNTLTQLLQAADETVENIAPTLSEAIDLVMMEELERELLRDED